MRRIEPRDVAAAVRRAVGSATDASARRPIASITSPGLA